ncbi:MAG: efflux RND transporter periplasmic adaptor subunit [Chryseolinea sp.]
MLKSISKTVIRNWIGYVSIALIVAGCVLKADDLENKKINKVKTDVINYVPVDGIVIEPGELKEELEVVGNIVANQQVAIVSELTRKITRVNVKEGTPVTAGTLLFQLDDEDLQAQLERLRQEERLAKLNEDRLRDLITHDAIAQQDYDQASTNLEVLKARIKELQVTISKTRITAPFAGHLGIINVHPGSIVSVNTVLTDIEDNSVVKVDFALPEKYTNVIKPGSQHTFTIASDRNEYKTTVIATAASVSQNTRTLLVRAATKNAEGHLIPGQSARLKLAVGSSNEAISVASNALIPTSKGYSVYVSRNNRVEPVAVQTGQRSAGSVEITEGLHKGDTVITSNILRLGFGSPVRFITLH